MTRMNGTPIAPKAVKPADLGPLELAQAMQRSDFTQSNGVHGLVTTIPNVLYVEALFRLYQIHQVTTCCKPDTVKRAKREVIKIVVAGLFMWTACAAGFAAVIWWASNTWNGGL